MSLWFAVRMLAAAAVATYGVSKVVTHSAARGRGTAILGAAEIALAVWWIASPLPSMTALSALLVGAAFTAAGLRSLRRTGTCGCGVGDVRSPAQLTRRNIALFGAIAAGALLGPGGEELAQSGAVQVEAVLVTPAVMTVLVGTAVVRRSAARLR